tara:strand:- start:189 stop:398 length:210 start_codon:yes stop_codon:yes gene_type:complete
MDRISVKERKDLERDSNSKAILSNDTNGYRKRLLQKKMQSDKRKEIQDLKTQVNKLTNLVEKLVEKLDK